ncbi:hypothetical protein EON65_45500 [archaeon]|nr:MAG: hypothetical protein EON65_45500 [archaeon]
MAERHGLGLVVGKQVINELEFNEVVYLADKNIVMTGANTGLDKDTANEASIIGRLLHLPTLHLHLHLHPVEDETTEEICKP